MRMNCVAPPTVEAVTLQQAKLWLRVDGDEENALISALISAAVAHLDGWTGVLGRALEEQTWELALDAFPSREIHLPLGPVVGVTSIKYDDAEGVEQTVDAADYYVDARSTDGWVIPVSAFAWPAPMSAANSIRVQWVAGTGTPPAIGAAILLHVGHLYANREAAAEAKVALPLGFDALVAPWRRISI